MWRQGIFHLCVMGAESVSTAVLMLSRNPTKPCDQTNEIHQRLTIKETKGWTHCTRRWAGVHQDLWLNTLPLSETPRHCTTPPLPPHHTRRASVPPPRAPAPRTSGMCMQTSEQSIVHVNLGHGRKFLTLPHRNIYLRIMFYSTRNVK